MSRLARFAGLLAAVAAILSVAAQPAFAYVPPDPGAAAARAATAPTIVTHPASSSGVATGVVLLIAIAAVVIGVGLTELGHVVHRRYRWQRPRLAQAS
jgi:hypothetical protein